MSVYDTHKGLQLVFKEETSPLRKRFLHHLDVCP